MIGLINFIFPVCFHQVIQTIRAADLDNFANGRFSFYVPNEHQANTNFTVKDNGGKTSVRIFVVLRKLPCTVWM